MKTIISSRLKAKKERFQIQHAFEKVCTYWEVRADRKVINLPTQEHQFSSLPFICGLTSITGKHYVIKWRRNK